MGTDCDEMAARRLELSKKVSNSKREGLIPMTATMSGDRTATVERTRRWVLTMTSDMCIEGGYHG
jgi:hypothetical protein